MQIQKTAHAKRSPKIRAAYLQCHKVTVSHPDHRNPLQHSYLTYCSCNALAMPWSILAKCISLPLVTDTSFVLYLREVSHYQTPGENNFYFFLTFWWELKSHAVAKHIRKAVMLTQLKSLLSPGFSLSFVLLLSLTECNKQKRMRNCSILYCYWTSWLNLL